MLYASYEDVVLKNLAQKQAREEAELESKVKSGKIKGIYRPKMSRGLKDKLTGNK